MPIDVCVLVVVFYIIRAMPTTLWGEIERGRCWINSNKKGLLCGKHSKEGELSPVSIFMRKIEEMLRLKYEVGLPHRAITTSCGVSAIDIAFKSYCAQRLYQYNTCIGHLTASFLSVWSHLWKHKMTFFINPYTPLYEKLLLNYTR